MPSRPTSSADINAVIAQVTPDVVALLADGVPRTKRTIITTLAGRHPKDDVRRTLMRLAVTERLVETGGKYSLPAARGAGLTTGTLPGFTPPVGAARRAPLFAYSHSRRLRTADGSHSAPLVR
jgi:hypothetical protein